MYLLEISCYFSVENRARQSLQQPASHHPSSDAKECREILGEVLMGWGWSGYSPASLQISLPGLDSDSQTPSSGSNKIHKCFNEFLGNLQLLSRLCIYVFVYHCFLLYVCVWDSSKGEDGLSECFYPNCSVQRAVTWAADREAFLKIRWSQWATLYDSERRQAAGKREVTWRSRSSAFSFCTMDDCRCQSEKERMLRVIFLQMGSTRQAQEVGRMKDPGKEHIQVEETALTLL